MKRTILRIIAILPAVALQLGLLYLLSGVLSPYATLITTLLSILALLFVLFIISNRSEGSYKTLWLLLIVSFPIPGAFMYLLFGNHRTSRPLKKRLEDARRSMPQPEGTAPGVRKSLAEENLRLSQTFDYVQKKTGYPLHFCDEAAYYPLGEDMHRQMLKTWRRRSTLSLRSTLSSRTASCGIPWWKSWPERRPRAWMCG